MTSINLDINQEMYEELKIHSERAAESIKEFIMKAVEERLEHVQETKKPNAVTLKALKSIEEGSDLTFCEDIDALRKALES